MAAVGSQGAGCGAPEWPPYPANWPDGQAGIGIPSRGAGTCKGLEVRGQQGQGDGGAMERKRQELACRIHMGNNKRREAGDGLKGPREPS